MKLVVETFNMIKMHLIMCFFVRLGTILCFIINILGADCGYAASMILKISPTISGSNIIPVHAGRITEAMDFGSKYLAVIIQDLHCHPEVQENIAHIIEAISLRHKLPAVYVEGGYGQVDTSWLASVADKQLRVSLADGLLSQGILTGGEYYSIISAEPYLLYGLENESLHKQNILRLGKIIERRESVNAVLRAFEQDLAWLERRYLGPRNRKLSNLIENHRLGRLESEKYYRQLSRYLTALQHGRLPSPGGVPSYETLASFQSLIALKRRINYPRATQQARQFLQDSKSIIPFAAYQYLIREAQGTPAAFYHRIAMVAATYHIDLGSRYPDLASVLAWTSCNQSLNPIQVLNEEQRLLAQLRMAFAQNTAELDTAFLADFYPTLRAYMQSSITADEYEYFRSNIERFLSVWKSYARHDYTAELVDAMELLNEYYETNCLRNDYFLKAIPEFTSYEVSQHGIRAGGVPIASEYISTVLEKADPVVLVAGGFHTAGLKKLLSERGISFLIITPQVSQETAGAAQRYEKIALEQAHVLNNAMQVGLLAQTSISTRYRLTLRDIKPQQLPDVLATLEKSTGIRAQYDSAADVLIFDNGTKCVIHRRQDDGIDLQVQRRGSSLSPAVAAALGQMITTHEWAQNVAAAVMGNIEPLLAQIMRFGAQYDLLKNNGLPYALAHDPLMTQERIAGIEKDIFDQFPRCLADALVARERNMRTLADSAQTGQWFRMLLAIDLVREFILRTITIHPESSSNRDKQVIPQNAKRNTPSGISDEHYHRSVEKLTAYLQQQDRRWEHLARSEWTNEIKNRVFEMYLQGYSSQHLKFQDDRQGPIIKEGKKVPGFAEFWNHYDELFVLTDKSHAITVFWMGTRTDYGLKLNLGTSNGTTKNKLKYIQVIKYMDIDGVFCEASSAPLRLIFEDIEYVLWSKLLYGEDASICAPVIADPRLTSNFKDMSRVQLNPDGLEYSVAVNWVNDDYTIERVLFGSPVLPSMQGSAGARHATIGLGAIMQWVYKRSLERYASGKISVQALSHRFERILADHDNNSLNAQQWLASETVERLNNNWKEFENFLDAWRALTAKMLMAKELDTIAHAKACEAVDAELINNIRSSLAACESCAEKLSSERCADPVLLSLQQQSIACRNIRFVNTSPHIPQSTEYINDTEIELYLIQPGLYDWIAKRHPAAFSALAAWLRTNQHNRWKQQTFIRAIMHDEFIAVVQSASYESFLWGRLWEKFFPEPEFMLPLRALLNTEETFNAFKQAIGNEELVMDIRSYVKQGYMRVQKNRVVLEKEDRKILHTIGHVDTKGSLNITAPGAEEMVVARVQGMRNQRMYQMLTESNQFFGNGKDILDQIPEFTRTVREPSDTHAWFLTMRKHHRVFERAVEHLARVFQLREAEHSIFTYGSRNTIKSICVRAGAMAHHVWSNIVGASGGSFMAATFADVPDFNKPLGSEMLAPSKPSPLALQCLQRYPQHFAQGKTLLSWEADDGNDEMLFAQRGMRVTATSTNQEMIVHLKQQASKIPFVVVDADVSRALPWLDNSFDVVYIRLAGHDLDAETQNAALREIARVLKPGGRAVIQVKRPNDPIFKNQDKQPLPTGMLWSPANRWRYHHISQQDLERTVIDAGLAVINSSLHNERLYQDPSTSNLEIMVCSKAVGSVGATSATGQPEERAHAIELVFRNGSVRNMTVATDQIVPLSPHEWGDLILSSKMQLLMQTTFRPIVVDEADRRLFRLVEYVQYQKDALLQIIAEQFGEAVARANIQNLEQMLIPGTLFLGRNCIDNIYFKEKRPLSDGRIIKHYQRIINDAPDELCKTIADMFAENMRVMGWDAALQNYLNQEYHYAGGYRIVRITDHSVAQGVYRLTVRLVGRQQEIEIFIKRSNVSQSSLRNERIYWELERSVMKETYNHSYLEHMPYYFSNPVGVDCLIMPALPGMPLEDWFKQGILFEKDTALTSAHNDIVHNIILQLANHAALGDLLGRNDRRLANTIIDTDGTHISMIADIDIAHLLDVDEQGPEQWYMNYDWILEDVRQGISEITLLAWLASNISSASVEIKAELFKEWKERYLAQWKESITNESRKKIEQSIRDSFKDSPELARQKINVLHTRIAFDAQVFLKNIFKAQLVDYETRRLYLRYLQQMAAQNIQIGYLQKYLVPHSATTFFASQLEAFRSLHGNTFLQRRHIPQTSSLESVYADIETLLKKWCGDVAVAELHAREEAIKHEAAIIIAYCFPSERERPLSIENSAQLSDGLLRDTKVCAIPVTIINHLDQVRTYIEENKMPSGSVLYIDLDDTMITIDGAATSSFISKRFHMVKNSIRHNLEAYRRKHGEIEYNAWLKARQGVWLLPMIIQEYIAMEKKEIAQQRVRPVPGARSLIESAQRHNMSIVLTTNRSIDMKDNMIAALHSIGVVLNDEDMLVCGMGRDVKAVAISEDLMARAPPSALFVDDVRANIDAFQYTPLPEQIPMTLFHFEKPLVLPIGSPVDQLRRAIVNERPHDTASWETLIGKTIIDIAGIKSVDSNRDRIRKLELLNTVLDIIEAHGLNTREYVCGTYIYQYLYEVIENTIDVHSLLHTPHTTVPLGLQVYFRVVFPFNYQTAYSHYLAGTLGLATIPSHNFSGAENGAEALLPMNEHNMFVFLEPILKGIQNNPPDMIILPDTGARPYYEIVRSFVQLQKLKSKVVLLPSSFHDVGDTEDEIIGRLTLGKLYYEHMGDIAPLQEYLIATTLFPDLQGGENENKLRTVAAYYASFFPLSSSTNVVLLDDNIGSGKTVATLQNIFSCFGVREENFVAATPLLLGRRGEKYVKYFTTFISGNVSWKTWVPRIMIYSSWEINFDQRGVNSRKRGEHMVTAYPTGSNRQLVAAHFQSVAWDVFVHSWKKYVGGLVSASSAVIQSAGIHSGTKQPVVIAHVGGAEEMLHSGLFFTNSQRCMHVWVSSLPADLSPAERDQLLPLGIDVSHDQDRIAVWIGKRSGAPVFFLDMSAKILKQEEEAALLRAGAAQVLPFVFGNDALSGSKTVRSVLEDTQLPVDEQHRYVQPVSVVDHTADGYALRAGLMAAGIGQVMVISARDLLPEKVPVVIPAKESVDNIRVLLRDAGIRHIVGISTSLKIAEADMQGSRDQLRALLSKYPARSTLIVSGGSMLPGIANVYTIADEMGFRTMGLISKKGEILQSYPVDYQYVSGEAWGDESSSYLDLCDELVVYGGGPHSLREGISMVDDFRKPLIIIPGIHVYTKTHELNLGAADSQELRKRGTSIDDFLEHKKDIDYTQRNIEFRSAQMDATLRKRLIRRTACMRTLQENKIMKIDTSLPVVPGAGAESKHDVIDWSIIDDVLTNACTVGHGQILTEWTVIEKALSSGILSKKMLRKKLQECRRHNVIVYVEFQVKNPADIVVVKRLFEMGFQGVSLDLQSMTPALASVFLDELRWHRLIAVKMPAGAAQTTHPVVVTVPLDEVKNRQFAADAVIDVVIPEELSDREVEAALDGLPLEHTIIFHSADVNRLIDATRNVKDKSTFSIFFSVVSHLGRQEITTSRAARRLGYQWLVRDLPDVPDAQVGTNIIRALLRGDLPAAGIASDSAIADQVRDLPTDELRQVFCRALAEKMLIKEKLGRENKEIALAYARGDYQWSVPLYEEVLGTAVLQERLMNEETRQYTCTDTAALAGSMNENLSTFLMKRYDDIRQGKAAPDSVTVVIDAVMLDLIADYNAKKYIRTKKNSETINNRNMNALLSAA